jgi:ABC-type multidrug transport system fused ATPase/permease subunit
MIALVGESGGGKSSLIKLIQRLYDPTAGAIFWDETDLRDASVLSSEKTNRARHAGNRSV